MGKFRPIHDGHAIEEAVVGIRLSTVATGQPLKAAMAAAKEIADRYQLPGRLKLESLAFMVGRMPVAGGFSSSAPMTGTVFQRVAEDGSIDSELSVDPSSVTYRTRRYRRWAEFVNVIRNALAPIALELAREQDSVLSVVEIRYTDRFFAALDENEQSDIKSLFKPDSILIAGHVMDLPGLWHSHSGWFEDQSEEKRTLVNVNIELVDLLSEEDEPRRQATVLKVVSIQSNPALGGMSIGEDFADRLAEVFQQAHEREKRLLSDLITDDLQNEIGLWASARGSHA